MNPYSSFLFARPSFAEGAARIVDLGNTLNIYNASRTDEEADALAMHADWAAVGEYVKIAMSAFEAEIRQMQTVREASSREQERLQEAGTADAE
jgi:hypothetical protein